MANPMGQLALLFCDIDTDTGLEFEVAGMVRHD